MNTKKLMANFVNALILEGSNTSFLTIPKTDSICVEHIVKSRFCDDFSFKIVINFASMTSFQCEVVSNKPDLDRYERVLNNTVEFFKFYPVGKTLFMGWNLICEDLAEETAASVLARTFRYMTCVCDLLPGFLFSIEENENDEEARKAIDDFLNRTGDLLEDQLINLMSEDDDDDFDPDDFLVDFDYE